MANQIEKKHIFLKFNEKYNKQIKTLISCTVEKVLCAGSWMVVVIVITMFVYMCLAQNKDYIFVMKIIIQKIS